MKISWIEKDGKYYPKTEIFKDNINAILSENADMFEEMLNEVENSGHMIKNTHKAQISNSAKSVVDLLEKLNKDDYLMSLENAMDIDFALKYAIDKIKYAVKCVTSHHLDINDIESKHLYVSKDEPVEVTIAEKHGNKTYKAQAFYNRYTNSWEFESMYNFNEDMHYVLSFIIPVNPEIIWGKEEDDGIDDDLSDEDFESLSSFVENMNTSHE